MAEINTDTLTVGSELTLTAGSDRALAMKPRSSSDTAPMTWYDQFDRPLAQIRVEEYDLDGTWQHRLIVATANAARTELVTRFAIDFGTNDPVIGFSDSRLRFDDGSAFLELRSPSGTYWRILVDDTGALVTEEAEGVEEPGGIPEDGDLYLATDEDIALLDEHDQYLLLDGLAIETYLLDEFEQLLFDDTDTPLVMFDFEEVDGDIQSLLAWDGADEFMLLTDGDVQLTFA